MQLREIAIQTLTNGHAFYHYENVGTTNRSKALMKWKVYDCYWNIYLGCAVYRRCKDMARRNGPVTIGRFYFSTNELADLYYNHGYGNFHNGTALALEYIQ
jgi:hypothetical protein